MVGLGLVMGAFITTYAQDIQPGDIIKIDANLVSVPVIVSDRDGRYVPGLAQADFKLLDNGMEQPIAFFDNAEEPLNVAILLDTSRSTQGVLGKIKDAAKNFIKKLRPQDRAMIVSFDYAIHRLSPLTNDRKVLEKAIKQAEVGELFGTILNDAVVDVIDRDLKPIVGRKAIILLTDGEDAGSRMSEPGLLSYVSEADTMIYPISYPSEFGRNRRGPFNFPRPGGGFPDRFPGRRRFPGRGGIPLNGHYVQQDPNQYPPTGPGRGGQGGQGGRRQQRDADAGVFLQRLADTTGGRYYKSEVTDLKKTFEQIAEELRHQYRLGFYPNLTADGNTLHTLKVKVDRPETAVRARGFYRTVGAR